ncbi:hypothetical protein A5874_000315, partial [Enterococcus faecium]
LIIKIEEVARKCYCWKYSG